MTKPKSRQRHRPPERKQRRGTPEAQCGLRDRCRAREFLLGLSDDELCIALENAPEGSLAPVLTHMGIQGGTVRANRGRQVFRARLRGLPAEVLHYALAVFASAPTLDLSRIVGLRTEEQDWEVDVEDGYDLDSLLRDGGLAALSERWPRGIVRVVLESLWDDGDLTTEQRDQFIEALEDPAALAAPDVVDTGAGEFDVSDNDGDVTAGDDEDVSCGDERARLRALREASDYERPIASATAPAAARQADSVAAPGGVPALEALIAQAVDRAQATAGSEPELSRLTSALEYLVGLDPTREDLWHLYGRVVAMSEPDEHATGRAPVLEAALPPARLEFLRGQLHTLAMRGEQGRVSALVLAHRDEAERLVSLPASSAGPTVAAILAANLDEPRRAARLLQAVRGPFVGWDWFVQAARARAVELIDADAPVEVEILLRAVEETLWQWSARSDRPGKGIEREATEVALLRAVCRRRRRDFAGVTQLLEEMDEELLDAEGRAAASREAGLAIAEIAGLEAVRFPRGRAERLQLRERLGRARPHLESAVEHGAGSAGNPSQLIATLLLGMLAACEDSDAEAARHLGTAAAALAEQPLAADLGLAVSFHAALARLRLLEPGTDDAAFHDMAAAMAGGYAVADDELVSAAVALEAHASPHAGAFLATAIKAGPTEPGLLELLAERARHGDAAAAAAAEERAGDRRLSLATRYSLLASALAGAAQRNDVAGAARLGDSIEEVLVRAGQASLDEQWAEILATNETLRLALEPAHADSARLEALRRVGRLDEARSIAKSLFFRAANASLRGFDASDLLGLLAELGTAEEELVDLERLVHERGNRQPAEVVDQLAAPVRVIFVGGNQVQEHYVHQLDATFAERYRGMVQVEWFMTGWSSNWPQAAERIAAAYERASIVVVMTFVRTNLGRWVRRTAGEHGLPWISCTGHGRASLERAIDRAVTVALEQAAIKLDAS